MVPKSHPLVKTAIELRRAIYRLEVLEQTNPNEFRDCKAHMVLANLRQTRKLIPSEYIDQDTK